MNIFITDPCPVESARNLDDKRVIKMILESAQLLSTALYLRGGLTNPEGKVYYFTGTSVRACAPTHVNHPCAIWTRQSRANYLWLVNHFAALLSEYTARYNKVHSYADKIRYFINSAEIIPAGELTAFNNSARNRSLGIDYTYLTNVPMAYQLYLADRWEQDKRQPTWYRTSGG